MTSARNAGFADAARLAGFLCLVPAVAWYLTGTSAVRISLMPEWLLVGATAPLYILAAGLLNDRARRYPAVARFGAIIDMILIGVLSATAVALALRGHRWYLGMVIFAQTLLVGDLLGRVNRGASRIPTWAVASVLAVSWLLTSGFPFTQLDDLLFNFAPVSPYFVVAFCLVLGLITYDALPEEHTAVEKLRALRNCGFFAALVIFSELSLRTDAIKLDWLPYHQSYFVDPVGFIRQGHWLLWDVPTQYGFLQIVAISLMPFHSTWQSYYIITALWTTIAASMLFIVLRADRSGWINYLSSLLICTTIYFGGLAQRWPFGYRFYPQVGLRFFPLIIVLFVIFLELRKRSDTTVRRRIRIFGHFAWIVAALWAFESAVWTTLAWATYVYLDELALRLQSGARFPASIVYAASAWLPMAIVGAAGVGAVEAYYVALLHHAPDWISYIEFSGIYSSNPGETIVLPLRADWEMVLSLGILGWAAILLLRERLFQSFAVVAGAWMAVWCASVYFAGEPYENHLAALIQVEALAWGLLLAVQKCEALPKGSTTCQRLAMSPLWIIVVASFLGQPGQWIHARMPFVNHYQSDILQEYRPIPGELAVLLKRAGVGPNDDVVFPESGGWSKLDNGIILPIARDDGRNREVSSWFLASAIGEHNTLLTLPTQRRTTITARFVALLKQGGWYVAYHRRAVCASLWPSFRTTRTIASENYEIAYCSLGGTVGSR